VSWGTPIKLHELARGPVRVTLEPDAEQRKAVARQLGLRSLPAFKARVTVKPWLDGAELTGHFEAVVEQVCGVSLEPFEQAIDGEIEVRVVPEGSPHAGEPEGGEIAVDPDAPDAPDVLDGDVVDVTAYAVEHLALELDPFPRKPGVTFDYKPAEEEASPFAALKKLQEPKG